MSKTKKITAEEFDRKFDAGEDISEYLDWDNAIKKVNVDFPIWMVKALDHESTRLGIPRQAVIKTWISDRLKEEDLLDSEQPTKKRTTQKRA